MRKLLYFVIMLLVSLNFMFPCKSSAVELSTGGTIYVPIYRVFYHGHASSKDAYGPTTMTP